MARKPYLVSLQLSEPPEKYQSLLKAIRALGKSQRFLDSSWVVKTDLNAKKIRDSLAPYIKDRDALMVVLLSREAAWTRILPYGSKWLKSNL